MNLSSNTRLSPHFTLGEFVRSETAEAQLIDNTPPDSAVIRLIALCCYTLEPLRSFWRKPIIINSGYRCPKLNDAVGGVPNSQHKIGEAADLRCSCRDEALAMLQCLLDNSVDFDQAIIETDRKSIWLHVSCKFDKSQNRENVITNMVKK